MNSGIRAYLDHQQSFEWPPKRTRTARVRSWLRRHLAFGRTS